ncbi:Aspartyl protease apcb1 [Thalictrum thalictroides]|uniref:Aspartic proteinase Asp1 n=1 Tax=Thalictrum thalictroides TaxID=46969 RepID=A0A7J6VEE8_THATH|nr:Aspartyl protease apcb1 [Thalictrum thalictroides]
MEMKWVFFGLFFLTLSSCCFSGSSAAEQNLTNQTNSTTGLFPLDRSKSSIVFPIQGSVYPDGYYYTTVYLGNPLKPYFLDIDTGSDLTWVQCDFPCGNCLEAPNCTLFVQAPHSPFPPNKNSVVPCSDPICAALHADINDDNDECKDPNAQCGYSVEYADGTSSEGVLLRDAFHLRFTDRSNYKSQLAFGCGYNQQIPETTTFKTDGILGLGNGDSSIVSQLRKLGVTQNDGNVVGHCIPARGVGYIFLGDALVPSAGVVWTSMSEGSSANNYYSPGPAELVYGTKSTGVKGLNVVFDTGSTFTYFNLQAYEAFISSLRNDLTNMPLEVVADETLTVCWKGKQPFTSVEEVKKYFTTVTLSFDDKAQFLIPPEDYLIITSNGNVCLGILDGSKEKEADLGDRNVIGDISLQNLLVIYDNEKQQIGWVPKSCNRPPSLE